MLPRAYLAYSASAHAALVSSLLLLGRFAPGQAPQTYRIDFIGPTAGIANRVLESSPTGRRGARAPTGRADPLRGDSFGGKRRPLPRPSLLGPAETPEKPDAKPPEPERVGAETGPSGGGAGAAGLSMDMPNFPYPWYITQVRTRLWERWSERMPEGGGEAVVRFAILKSGNITDLRTAESSGDGAFDDVALSAVKDAAPFQALPEGFGESFLNVHVRFTAR